MKIMTTAIMAGLLTTGSAQAAEYLIKLKADTMTTLGFQSLAKNGIHVKRTIPELNIVIADSDATSVQKFAILANSPVRYAELNTKVKAINFEPLSVRPQFKVFKRSKKDGFKQADWLWATEANNAVAGWKIEQGKPEVVLAVSDTGTWMQHGDLAPVLWKNPGESGLDANGVDKSKNKVDDDGNGFVDDITGWNFQLDHNKPQDDHYHGTHVAGTVGANGLDTTGVVGVSWNVRIMSLKFLGSDGSGTNENGIRTILYAANNGAKAVNCSWGSDEYSQALHDAIEYAKERGTLVIAAAGNDGQDADKHPLFPAAYDNENIISVGATTNKKHQLAGFSNWGATTVDLGAPGENIYSTWNPMQSPLRRVLYYTISGTSMATPQVTGTVGLLYSANPRLKWRQVKEIILSTVTKSKYWAGKSVSGGALNVGEAVLKAKNWGL